jgi:hypothetical protein
MGSRSISFRASPDQAKATVLTGHDDGLITLNVTEADDLDRVNM